MAGTRVEVREVSHTFPGKVGGLRVLANVNLDVRPGEFVSIVGPSGCGKSTILRMLAGLLAPSAGDVLVGGTSAVGVPGRVAYMPQRDLLLPWRKALGNAALGAEIGGMEADEAREKAQALFGRFGLAGFEEAWPSQLSGGMRQRLALLRTFLIQRDVLLLDEPFGALDAITRREMQGWLQEVWQADGRTVLFVTHDVEEALVLSDRVVVMTPRPGRIGAVVEVGVARPRGVTAVTAPEFVRLKAELLGALEAGITP
ncbi:MAG: ABC transporter ATP-binding protein [Tepidiformaceae bacterium]